MKRYRSIQKDTSALSSAITITLLMSITAAALSGMLADKIPEWGAESERRHMEDVRRQIGILDNGINAIMNAPDGGTGAYMSTRIPLSARGDNMAGVGQTVGTLSIEPITEDVSTSSMMVTQRSGSDEDLILSTGGRISYRSNNVFFTEVDYVFEMGAIISITDETVSMVTPPELTMTTNLTGAPQITLISPKLIGVDRKISHEGSATVICRMAQPYFPKTLDSDDPLDVSVYIGTDYPQVWQDFFTERFVEIGLSSPVDYSFSDWDDGGSLRGTRLDLNDIDYFTTGSAIIEIDVE